MQSLDKLPLPHELQRMGIQICQNHGEAVSVGAVFICQGRGKQTLALMTEKQMSASPGFLNMKIV